MFKIRFNKILAFSLPIIMPLFSEVMNNVLVNKAKEEEKKFEDRALQLSNHNEVDTDAKKIIKAYEHVMKVKELIDPIIQQAFRDMGYKKPVDVILEYHSDSAEMRLNSVNNHPPHPHFELYTYIKQRERFACICVRDYYLEDILKLNHKLIYAVAGHEATHMIKQHSLLLPFGLGLLLFPPIAFLPKTNRQFFLHIAYTCSMFFLYFAFKRGIERDADIISARKLGTSKYLSKYFNDTLTIQQYCSINNKDHDIKKTLYEKLISVHPYPEERISYLNRIERNLASPAFFKSETFFQLKAKQKALIHEYDNYFKTSTTISNSPKQ